MRVKELIKYLQLQDENLEVCFLQNAGQGYGELPFPIKPIVKEVRNYDGELKKIITVN